MTYMNMKRAYSSAVRSEQAAATRQRIVGAAQELFVDPTTDFTLDRVASMSGVSVQTVLRAFGNRETLILEAIGTFRASEQPVVDNPPRSIADAVHRLFDDYEEIGDRVIRMLAEEHRIPGFDAATKVGRERHRIWVEAAFAEQLAAHPKRRRAVMMPGLLAVTDVYVWKLLRRDFGLDRAATEAIVERLVRGALVDNKGE